MTDPRKPRNSADELPDALNQNPVPGVSEAAEGRGGSADAQLLAGAGAPEGDVENSDTAEAALSQAND
jgi:hypothetical protein